MEPPLRVIVPPLRVGLTIVLKAPAVASVPPELTTIGDEVVAVWLPQVSPRSKRSVAVLLTVIVEAIFVVPPAPIERTPAATFVAPV